MKPLGIKYYKCKTAKHKVSGADRKRGYVPWWIGICEPNKKRSRQINKLYCKKQITIINEL